MSEVYGGNDTADHKYFVIWSNDVVTLKTGFGTDAAAIHHARLVTTHKVGTVHSISGPNGELMWRP